MSYTNSLGRSSRPSRYRSTNQQGNAYTMSTTFTDEPSQPLSRQIPTQEYQREHQAMSSSAGNFAQSEAHQHRGSSEQGSMSSINNSFGDYWSRQMALLPEEGEEAPEVVRLRADRLTTSLLTAKPFKLKSIEELYNEALESEDEKFIKALKNEQVGLTGVQRSTTRAEPRTLRQETMERPQNRRTTQWPGLPTKRPSYKSPPNELWESPGTSDMDGPAWQHDNVPCQAGNTTRPQPSRNLLEGSTAWRYDDNTASVEYHQYLREAAMLENKARKMREKYEK